MRGPYQGGAREPGRPRTCGCPRAARCRRTASPCPGRGAGSSLQETVNRCVSVGDVRAGDLVVAVVLAEAAGRCVDRRRRVPALGQPSNGLVRRVGVVLRDVEDPARVERVPLPVQPVARVLDERDQVVREERRVVESRPSPVTAVEDREARARCARPALTELEDRAPAALVLVLGARRVRVAGLVEVELSEAGAGTETSVLRALERGPVGCLGERVRVERRVPVDRGVVDRHPVRLERRAVDVQRGLVRRLQRRLGRLCDRMLVGVVAQDLEHLSLPLLRSPGLSGTYRNKKLFGTFAVVPCLLAPLWSSRIIMLPSESSETPS